MGILTSCILIFKPFFCAFRYNGQHQARIGQYCAIHGPSATARFFSRKLKRRISENTVKSIKKCIKKSSGSEKEEEKMST